MNTTVKNPELSASIALSSGGYEAEDVQIDIEMETNGPSFTSGQDSFVHFVLVLLENTRKHLLPQIS